MSALPMQTGMPMPGAPPMQQPQQWQPPMAMPMPQPPPPPPAPPRKRPQWMTDGYLLAMAEDWDKKLDSHWGEWVEEAKLCYDVQSGRQWDKDAEDDAKDRGLTIVKINKVDSTVEAICGSQKSNQMDVRYYPREISTKGPTGQRQDVVVNEILTEAAKWARDECGAEDEESEAFRDMIICGLGFTETRMDYENDPEGMPVVERVDPLEMRIGVPSVRRNAVDAKYLRRKKGFTKQEAYQRFGISEGDAPDTSRGSPHDADSWTAYQKGSTASGDPDIIWVSEYQFIELETVYQIVDPMSGQLVEIEEDEFQQLQAAMGDALDYHKQKTPRYYRMFRADNQIVECEPLPEDEFTYKVITGRHDRNASVWYGVVRAMIDPQRLLNKQVSQIQRIIDTNAKGGLLAETDAFEDTQEAEERWAGSDTIVWTKEGAVKDGRVIPKPIANYPAGIDKLLAIANEAVPGVSGVNNEMLGIIDREQAGVVDVQRKEAAYGVLKGFFNAMRGYHRLHGRHLLKLIQKYMSDGRLVRIIGRNGNVQYLPLVRDPNTAKFDVIVDEAPTSPNQKDKVFQFLLAFGGPLLSKLNLPPEIMMKFLEFSPLPTALVAEIMQAVSQIPKGPDPETLKAQAEQQKLQAQMAEMQQNGMLEQQRMQMEAQAHQVKMQGEMQKLQADNAKLAVENKWVEIDAARASMEATASQQEAALRARETQMREQNDAAKIQADIRKMEIDAEIKRQELEIKRADLEIRRAELGLKQREHEQRAHEADIAAQMDAAQMDQDHEHAQMDFHHREEDRASSERVAQANNDTKERTTQANNAAKERAAKKTDAKAKPAAAASRSTDKWAEVSTHLQALTEALNKPRKVIRDAGGRATGIE